MAQGIPAQPGRYFDSWDEAEAAAKAHAQLSEANAYDGGDAELGEARTHYERASAARAAAAVREPLAAPDAPGGSSPGGRVDPDVRAEALVEASFYDEVLHPRNRLGEWLHNEFREVQASSKHTGKKRQHRNLRGRDRREGQDARRGPLGRTGQHP